MHKAKGLFVGSALVLVAAVGLGLALWGGGARRASGPLRAVRLACWQRGVYRVTGADLQKLGVDLSAVRAADLTLVHMNDAVPLLLRRAGGRLRPESELIFYSGGGKAAPLPYVNMDERFHPATQDFMLYLDRASWTPRRYEEVSVKAPARVDLRGWPVATVNGRLHYEKDPIWDFFKIAPGGDPIDFVFWQKLSYPATTENPSAAELDFELPKIESAGEVEMEVFMVGRTEIGEVAHNVTAHRVAFTVNGVHRAEASWSGERGRIRFTVPASVVHEGLNRLKAQVLEPFIDSAVSGGLMNVDVVFLDWFEARFRQRTQLEGDYNEFLIGTDASAATTATLAARPAGAEPLHFSIRQLTSPNVLIFDVDRGLQYVPRPFEQGRGSPLTAVNMDLPDRPTRLVAATDKRLLRPVDMTPVRIRGLFDRPNDAEMLILAPPQFVKPLERLAAWKRARGLSVSIVDIKDLFNERTSGYASPVPLRDYIRRVYGSQPRPRLRYVLLVGDSSSIFKEVTQLPAYSYVQGGRHANDNYFATLGGPRDNPVVAVGRVPVQNAAQLETVIDKIVGYEKGEGRGPWRSRFLLIAASHQWASADCDKIRAKYLGRYQASYLKTDIGRRDLAYHAELNRTLTDEFNAGNLITMFFGHGGGGVWEVGPTSMEQGFQRHLFDQSAVAALKNAPRLPLVFALTCYTNDFDSPYHPQTLGETFVDAPSGAIAVIGANDRSYIEFNSRYIDTFMGILFRPQPPARLGDVFLQSKLAMSQPVSNEHYQLLGDPSLEFSLPRGDVALDGARLVRGELSARCALDRPSEAGPWQLDGYVLDSRDRVVVHWHEDQAPGTTDIARRLDGAAQAAARRLLVYMSKPGSGDHVGAATIDKADVAAAATPAPPEAGSQ